MVECFGHEFCVQPRHHEPDTRDERSIVVIMAACPRVSLSMIVRNEETQLLACLEPVAHLFAEKIIVDTGSTDQTRTVAASLGCRILDFPWCDNFAAARNETLRHVCGDWVFWLDADDRVDDRNARRLEELFASLGSENHAYLMACISIPLHAADPAQVSQHCRLFRADPEIRWSRRVHEQVQPSIEQLGHAVLPTDIQIHHLGYQDPALVRRKNNRDLRLLRLEYATDPSDPFTLYNLGVVHMRMGQNAEALPYLCSALKAATGFQDWIRVLYDWLENLLDRLGRWDEALRITAEGLTRFPGDPVLLTRRADLLLRMGNLFGAEDCLLQLLSNPVDPRRCTGELTSIDRRGGRRLLGWVYIEQRRLGDAERIFQELLQEHPEYVQARWSLGYIYLLRNRFSDVEIVAQQTEQWPCGPAYAAILRGQAFLARGEGTLARQQLAQAIALAPQMVLARIVLADCLLKSGAPLADCIAAHRDILRLNPGNLQVMTRLDLLAQQQNRPAPSGVPWTFTVCAGS